MCAAATSTARANRQHSGWRQIALAHDAVQLPQLVTAAIQADYDLVVATAVWAPTAAWVGGWVAG
jgi:hypothetical protein